MDTSRTRLLSPDRERYFPKLCSTNYEVTSREDYAYNCIAWAVGEEHTDNCWNPFQLGHGYYWPEGIEQNASPRTFIDMFRKIGGYEVCDSSDFEPGFEKIVLYVSNDGEVTHAARQKPDGRWTSKLGDWEDISHIEADALEGADYGKLSLILKRLPRTS